MTEPAYNRDDVRMLVLSIGYKATAEKTGIKYGTLRQWAKRGKWFQQKPTNSQLVTPVTKPVDALFNTLKELENRTKLSLAKSVNRMATDAEQVSLREAPYVHKAAQTASIVHGWNNESNKGQNILNLGVLIGNAPEKDSDKVNTLSIE